MDEKLVPLKNIQRRAAAAATKRGHTAGLFAETITATARDEKVAAVVARCTRCGGEIWALANGEISVPRLCRSPES